MSMLGYVLNELRRRWSRTVVTAIGLAAGVALAMAIVGVSDGLNQAQNKVLSPLSSVGTDIVVTRTVGATTSSGSPTTTTTTTSPYGYGQGGSGQGPVTAGGPGPGGGGFFAQSPGRAGSSAVSKLNSSDRASLLNANSSVLTDLAKLGPAGTKFTHDFFVPGTLITFPDQAVSMISSIKGVTAAVPGLSLQAIHESGTVPKITATYKTGGQTLTAVAKPPPLTTAQQAALRQCLQSSGVFQTLSSGGPKLSGRAFRPKAVFKYGAGAFGGAFTKCLPASYQQYEAQVTVPEQTINQVLNPPTTNTQTKTYTVAGADPSATTTGVITKSQLVSGSWFGSSPADEILVDNAYASTNGIKAGQNLTINGKAYTVVGLVNPTVAGNASDIYFDLATLQGLSSSNGRVNEVMVKVAKSSEVNQVAAAIKKEMPGAQVLTSKQLANQVTGSLADTRTLWNNLRPALLIIVLLAAFLIAALLTLSSITKRVREIGTLRAIGWSKARVVRQILVETLGIGILGAGVGLALGVGVAAAIGAFGPSLTSTATGTAVGASTVGSIFHQATTASQVTKIHLTAPLDVAIIILGLASALVGGLLAGIIGGWRAARLAPASAMRDVG